MKLGLFIKLLVVSTIVSLMAFALMEEATLLFLAKSLALGLGLSIAIAAVYPDIRGVRQGDNVVVLTSSLPFFAGKIGRAMTSARKNNEIKIRFDNGEEAVGILESYAGLVSPPKVRILYEERLVE